MNEDSKVPMLLEAVAKHRKELSILRMLNEKIDKALKSDNPMDSIEETCRFASKVRSRSTMNLKEQPHGC